MNIMNPVSFPLLDIFSSWQAQGFWANNVSEIKTLLAEKLFIKALLNPLILIAVAILIIFGFVVKNKKIFLGLFAFYGYATVHYFSLARVQNVAFDIEKVNAPGLSNVLLFFGGFIVVTSVLLYFIFIKGES